MTPPRPRPKPRPLWTKKEDALLRKHRRTHSVPQLQALLPHRSRSAIHSRCRALGLDSLTGSWTQAEYDLLTDHYPPGGAAACHALLPHRSITAIMQAASRLGIKRDPVAKSQTAAQTARRRYQPSPTPPPPPDAPAKGPPPDIHPIWAALVRHTRLQLLRHVPQLAHTARHIHTAPSATDDDDNTP